MIVGIWWCTWARLDLREGLVYFLVTRERRMVQPMKIDSCCKTLREVTEA